jgi:HlyD family secretion protein
MGEPQRRLGGEKVEMSIPGLFRSDALNKLRSPEQLDNAFRLTSPAGWFILIIIGVAIVCAFIWSFVGTLPDQVSGMGMMLQENSTVYGINAPTVGRLTEVSVKVGQTVHAGDQIAALALPDQEVQREGSQKMLADLHSQLDHMTQIFKDEQSRRAAMTKDRIAGLNQKIDSDKQRKEYLQKELATEQAELKDGYVRQDEVEGTKSQIHALEQSIRESQNAIAAANTEEIDFEDQQYRTLTPIKQQILSEENHLASIETSINNLKVVTTPVDGTVTEVSAKQGTMVGGEDQLAVIEKAGNSLRVIAYVPVNKGKTVAPGMRASVSPTSVESSIYGSIRGTVSSVSSLPATRSLLTSTFGDSSIVSKMMEPGPVIQVVVDLTPDANTVSGLAWTSSKGPPLKVTPGGTATVAITVKEDKPIDLVVPIYETWLGGGNG